MNGLSEYWYRQNAKQRADEHVSHGHRVGSSSEPEGRADLELARFAALAVLVEPPAPEEFAHEVDARDGRPEQVERGAVGVMKGVARLDVEVLDVDRSQVAVERSVGIDRCS